MPFRLAEGTSYKRRRSQSGVSLAPGGHFPQDKLLPTIPPRVHCMRLPLLITAALFTLAAPVRAAEPVDNDYFEKRVRPILVQHCVGCHGEKKQKGELRLDLKAGFAKGGESGPAVVPGKPDESRLVKAVGYADDIKMPPKGKLTDADIATLTEWVKGGAPWPDDGAVAKGPEKTFDLRARAKAHWSFQPIRRPSVPEIEKPKDPKLEIRNEIDRFLLARLQKEGLTFAPPADKRALLRRVYFDLVGLPPAPAEIVAFLKDEAPDAYEKVVDKLLASPQYGERWGRHWLDLVRYAETHGHEFDFEIPDAWRYRDYVIRSFNADVPYDQFLTEHIAGDLLPPRRNPKTGANEALLATGFWWLGEAKHSPVDSRAEFADRTDNQIDVFGKAVFGLTISCARCHDHKFDAIATKDYYALFGVITSSRYNRTDVGDPTAAIQWLDELAGARTVLNPSGLAVLPPNTSDAVRKRNSAPAGGSAGTRTASRSAPRGTTGSRTAATNRAS
jgi:mono/diheme cytochrome c family protein